MTMVTVSRYHDFSYGHRVAGHENKCKLPHGHNGRVTFHCSAPQLDEVGRVIDFGVIKTILCDWLEANWDHKFLVFAGDPVCEQMESLFPEGGIVAVPFNPTAENMALYLLEVVGPRLLGGTGITLVRVEVEETRKCSAAAEL